jgi:soluble lytic murein transglycosylase
LQTEEKLGYRRCEALRRRSAIVTPTRIVLSFALAAFVVGDASAKPRPRQIPLPRPRPTITAAETGQIAARSPSRKSVAEPLQLSPQNATMASIPPSGVLAERTPWRSATPGMPPPPVAAPAPARLAPPLAMAATTNTSPLDLAAAKQAIDLVHKGRSDAATAIEATIADPLARKIVEWIILRSDEADLDFARYASFIEANPSWPGLTPLRRRAEAVLWQQQIDPRTVVKFFANEPPRTGKGRLALARALVALGDRADAMAAVREAWRKAGLSADVEVQALDEFVGLLSREDDEARMHDRFDVEDIDGGLRAARRLGAVELAIAQARSAVISRSSRAKKLLDQVPPEGRRDSGYMLSRIQWLRRADKIVEAAQLMLAAPHERDKIGDPDQWWLERRVIARKLLDLGQFKAAYEIADGAVTPNSENYRAERYFIAGWIALRFLRQPGLALAQFARIGDGVVNPITLARANYWQGRAAEALGRGEEARVHYEAAARYPTAYYGQLARARLGIDAVTLHRQPQPAADDWRLEVARVFQILYALDESDLAALIAVEFANKVTDVGALAAVAEIAARHNDARTTLLIGKTALGHGLPFDNYAFPDFGVPNYQQIGPAVERCVVYSIVRQESAFNPKVVSSANALGLMQVTPQAGRDTAKRFRVSFDRHRLVSDVAYNAQLGTAELGNDLATWRGSYILAFVAYNAGPRRAREWIEQYGDPRNPKVDPVDWIERIPIAETRNYVQRVIENMQVYRARLDRDPRLLIEADLRRGG